MSAEDAIVSKRLKLFALVGEMGLTRDERLDYSEQLLRRDVATWKTLTDGEVQRLLDGLESVLLIAELLRQRP